MGYVYKIIRLSEVSAFHIAAFLAMAVISSLLSVIPIQFLGYSLDVLSGGERSRVGFARAAVKNTDIVILDEVTASLDSANAAVIYEIINELKQQGKIIFYVSHGENPLSADETILINA